MSSWLTSLTRRTRPIRSSKKTRKSLPMMLESLEERAVPAAFLTYSTAGSVYNQTFNSMPNTLTLAPNISYTTAGPHDLSAQAGYTAAGLSGWLFGNAVGGTLNSGATNASLRINPGNSGTLGIFFNAGVTTTDSTTSGTDRALTVRPNVAGFGSADYGMAILNNTGNTLASFTLGATAEIWKKGATAAGQTAAFSYLIDSSPTANFLATTGTTPVAALNLTSPNTTAANNTQLVGDLPGNRSVIAPVTVTGLSWAPGQYLLFHWNDNSTGFNDILGVDDFSFAAASGGPTANSDVATAFTGVSTSINVLANDTPAGAVTITGLNYASGHGANVVVVAAGRPPPSATRTPRPSPAPTPSPILPRTPAAPLPATPPPP